MLRELKDVQKPGEPYRRWFEDDYFDLVVWYMDSKEIMGFQIAYERQTYRERALTWMKDSGFSHNKIDDPVYIGSKSTPIMIADGSFPVREILDRFLASSTGLETPIVEFIERKMLEYGDIQRRASHKGTV